MSEIDHHPEAQPSNGETKFTTADQAQLQRMLAADPQPRAPHLTASEMRTWIQDADTSGVLDRPAVLRDGDRRETVEVDDAVYLSAERSATGEREPIVVVRHQDGHTEDINAFDFLRRIGFDVESYRVDQARVAVDRAARKQSSDAREHAAAQQLNQDLYTARQKEMRVRFAPSDNSEQHTRLTPQSRSAAASRIEHVLAHDGDFTFLMRNYVRSHPEAGRDAFSLSNAIRSDTDLRVSLGEHFSNAVGKLPEDRVPRGVWQNEGKGAAHSNLKMGSRDYVARLCLAMLDGTYNSEREQRGFDRVILDKQGVAEFGKHRYTARLVLGLDRFDRTPDMGLDNLDRDALPSLS